MPLDEKLLENLLHQGEGNTLDYKSQQYPFEKATVAEKSELLKDILAFANSWRQTDAYILIGIKETEDGRASPVGVEGHLEDASLHQFVNEKTQRAVDFTYRKVQFAGVSIGVIEIPIQERPTYLTKRFGKLGSSAVYVRNGSSTREATPDEIARMGAEQALGGTPQIALHWADLEKRATLPSLYEAQSTLLDPASLLEQPLEWIHNESSLSAQYTREVIEYTRDRATFTSLGFLAHNGSSVVGQRIQFEGSLDKSTGVSVRQWADVLPPKRHRRSNVSNISLSPDPLWNEPEPSPRYPLQYDGGPYPQVLELQDRWNVIINFGDIRPQDTVWTNVPLWFGSEKDTTAALDGQLRGDNLSKSVTCSLEIQFQVGARMMMREDTFPHIES